MSDIFVNFSVRLQGNLGQAELIGREALRLLPNDHTIMFSLANVLGKLQKYKVNANIAWRANSDYSSRTSKILFLALFSVSALNQEWCISLTSKCNSVCFFSILSLFSQESEGFFLHALRINPNAASCHGNLGKATAILCFQCCEILSTWKPILCLCILADTIFCSQAVLKALDQ